MKLAVCIGEEQRADGRRASHPGARHGPGSRLSALGLPARARGRLAGRVCNDPQGVTIEAFGPLAALDAFLSRLRAEAPPAARLDEVREEPIPAEPRRGVLDRPQPRARARGGSRSPPTSPPARSACASVRPRRPAPPLPLHELHALRARATRSPATCPTTGPPRRWPASPMCPDCRAGVRRPVATGASTPSPIACPACGPRLRLRAAGREPRGSAAATPSRSPRPSSPQGRIVAVKGLGGFHLACDATSSEAVRRLRERKKRDEKPFAVMVGRPRRRARRWPTSARTRSALLDSVERPIVLVRQRAGNGLAPEVAPGNPLVGPHPRLHAAPPPPPRGRGAPAGHDLAATSPRSRWRRRTTRPLDAARRHRRPLPRPRPRDREPLRRLGGPGDRGAADGPPPRRAATCRGPSASAGPCARPVLACGAHLKNTFCLGRGRRGLARPAHRRPRQPGGDARLRGAGRAAAALPRRPARGDRPRPAPRLRLDPLRARAGPEAAKVAVQHHHAHVASAMAEHGLDGPVLGLAWDGTGYGTGRDGLGRRAAARATTAASSGWRRCAPSASPAATRRSARSGASPSPRSTTPSTARRRSTGCGSSPPCRARDRGGRPADAREGPERAARPRRRPLLRRRRRARPRRGRGRATRARWPSSGTWPRTTGEAGGLPVRARGGGRPRPGRPAAARARRRSGTSLSGRRGRPRLGPLPRGAWPTWRRRSCGGPPRERGPLPVVLTGGCFQNARLAEGVQRRLARRASTSASTARCRRATAGRPRPGAGRGRGGRGGSARVSVRRRGGRAEGACAWRFREGRGDHGRGRAADGEGRLRRACSGRPASPTCPRRGSATTCSSTSASRSPASTRQQAQETLARSRDRRARGARREPATEPRRARRGEGLMRHVDEYRDPAAVAAVVRRIRETVTRPWTLMEVCGGQTHSILKFGMDELLPPRRAPRPRPGLPGLRHARSR